MRYSPDPQAAAVMADFLAAHRGNGAAASSATGALLQQLLASSHIMGPFLEASGVLRSAR